MLHKAYAAKLHTTQNNYSDCSYTFFIQIDSLFNKFCVDNSAARVFLKVWPWWPRRHFKKP